MVLGHLTTHMDKNGMLPGRQASDRAGKQYEKAKYSMFQKVPCETVIMTLEQGVWCVQVSEWVVYIWRPKQNIGFFSLAL